MPDLADSALHRAQRAPGLLELPWALPPNVRAFVTTRHGGSSAGAFGSFNLAGHVGDDPVAVRENRLGLLHELRQRTGGKLVGLQWLQQVHGDAVANASLPPADPPPVADALYSTCVGLGCAVLTADCLPVLIAADDGSEIAVAHAGWRGLCAGVLEATLTRFITAPHRLLVWCGPAIGPCHFEVGSDVRGAFLDTACASEQAATDIAFRAGERADKWYADLYALARLRLQRLGVKNIAGKPHCTLCHQRDFYSHRAGAPTGRFATLILRTH
jgi:YfiH family protein